jgi:hypothetical protein
MYIYTRATHTISLFLAKTLNRTQQVNIRRIAGWLYQGRRCLLPPRQGRKQTLWGNTMRRPLLLLILAISAVLGTAVYLVSTLIGLLFETGLQNAISPESLASRASWTEDRHPIPKIIHQTWKNETIPEAWSIAQYSCRDLHPDYKYIVPSPLQRPFVDSSYGRMKVAGNLLKRNILGF